MGKLTFIDTHCHLDGEEFAGDLEAVVARAREAGVGAIGVPGIDQRSAETVMALCRRYPGYCYPMFGLHPEEVKADWETVLDTIRKASEQAQGEATAVRPIAVGEVGLDFYWSREFEREQLLAFEAQVKWSVETGLPLMIHCRKAQNELVAILKRYQDQLPGGVFHCFTGNALEAKELLQFERFVLGIGGVLTFKKSHLPEVLPEAVPSIVSCWRPMPPIWHLCRCAVSATNPPLWPMCCADWPRHTVSQRKKWQRRRMRTAKKY